MPEEKLLNQRTDLLITDLFITDLLIVTQRRRRNRFSLELLAGWSYPRLLSGWRFGKKPKKTVHCTTAFGLSIEEI